MNAPTYVVITPVRDEADYVVRTIESMAAQTLRAARWIIVDDGSTDGTPQILDAAAARHSWITVIHRRNRGARASSDGMIEAFNEGYPRLAGLSWNFLVNLDGDLSFDEDYFSRALEQFAVDASLGIGGGTICVVEDGELKVESVGDPPFHVRGATKIYRRECWDEIGPLIKAPGWDTVDEVKANMKGWATRTFPEIHLVHLKPTGIADGTWLNAYKNGRANYVTGYDPLFMLAKCFKRAFTKPLIVCGLAMGAGFCSGYLKRLPQVPDLNVIRYLRRQQRRRLLLRSSIYS
jgi:glycosyltransferase involved in cell wall biosynthesis